MIMRPSSPAATTLWIGPSKSHLWISPEVRAHIRVHGASPFCWPFLVVTKQVANPGPGKARAGLHECKDKSFINNDNCGIFQNCLLSSSLCGQRVFQRFRQLSRRHSREAVRGGKNTNNGWWRRVWVRASEMRGETIKIGIGSGLMTLQLALCMENRASNYDKLNFSLQCRIWNEVSLYQRTNARLSLRNGWRVIAVIGVENLY